jgi:hypothetical protein
MSEQWDINYYESQHEVLRCIKEMDEKSTKTGPPWQYEGFGRQSTNNDDKWAGGTYSAMHKYLEYGWSRDRDSVTEDVERTMDELRERLNLHLDTGFRETYDVSGGYVDIGRYLDGEPECMVEQWVEPMPKKGKVLKVLTNITASAFIDSATISKRGRAVVVATEVLHRMGFGLELWCGEAVKGNEDRTSEMVKIKEAGDPMDWDAVMFMLSNPMNLRRVTFALNELRDKDQKQRMGFTEYGGYGSPCEFPEEITNQFDVNMPMLRSNDFDATAFIKEILVTAEVDKVEEFE